MSTINVRAGREFDGGIDHLWMLLKLCTGQIDNRDLVSRGAWVGPLHSHNAVVECK